MDDIIPFLIVMAISIVGSIVSRRKRVKGNSTPAFLTESEEQDDMPEWFKRFIPEEELVEEVQPVNSMAEQLAETRSKVENKQTEPVTPPKFHQFTGFISPQEKQHMMSLEGARSITDKSKWKTDHEQVAPNPIKVIAKNKKTPFDLRQAVIHSEILNRKY